MSAAKPKVWFVGGGTGGHIVPLIAVAEASRAELAITFVGSYRGPERQLAKRSHFPFVPLATGKWRRDWAITSLLANIVGLAGVGIGMMQALYHLVRVRPRLVFSKGGPVALPVAVAAWVLGIPIVTHESDIVMGWANRVIARLAKRVLTGFPVDNYPYVSADKLVWVGVPLRREFTRRYAPPRGRPMVLVTGGSQGAQSVGEVVLAALPQLLNLGDVMHVCGPSLEARCVEVKRRLPDEIAPRYGYTAYSDNMARLIAEATVVVTRAGSQMFEIATLRRPIIAIPLPWAANNHQLKNAQYFASRGAALVVRQEHLTAQRLYETIASVLENRQLRQQLVAGGAFFDSRNSTAKTRDALMSLLQ